MAQKKDNSNTLIIVALVVALGIGGYFYWRSKQVKPQKEILKDIFENLTFENSISQTNNFRITNYQIFE